MYTFLIILHVIVCILLIITVLMQTSKGNALGGAFGGGGGPMGGGNLFGARQTASLLSKFTTGLAVGFFVITLLITISFKGGSQSGQSVIKERANQQSSPAAGLPAPQGDMPGRQGSQNQGSQQQQPGQVPAPGKSGNQSSDNN